MAALTEHKSSSLQITPHLNQSHSPIHHKPSGLAFKFSRSEKVGARIKEILVAGQPIDLEKEYIVATNDFLAAGGDGYKAFGEAIKASSDFSVVGGVMKGEKVAYSHSGRWLRDIGVEYAREARRIAPTVEGRIVEVQ